MRHSRYQSSRRYRLDLVTLARSYRKRLPQTELPYYDAYMAHLGRDDVVKAMDVAERRSDPQLWAGATPDVYRSIRQAYSVCEKVTQEGNDQARVAAWQKFLLNEDRCRRTNRKIRYLRWNPSRVSSVSRGVMTLFDIASIRKTISDILGDFWRSYPTIVGDLAFGKGMTLSSTDVHKTSVPFKLCDDVSVTADALPVWRDFLLHGGFTAEWGDIVSTEGRLLKVRERVQIVPGCRITFVDKTSVIKRTIAIEPSANVAMQLAIHRYLARQLKRRTRIDITDQTQNRAGALQGSLDGSLATIDLSSASDLISTEVVKLLLPKDWFDLFDALRSKCGVFRGETCRFQKFSSMGNGFTFALETIIFYAITRTACDKGCPGFEPLVYGDDIIVRSSDFQLTVRYLQFFGFRVNTRKSYADGPFRESCGLDAFRGVDVRPVFLKAKALTMTELVSFHNHCFQRKLYDICEYVVSLVPESLRLFGPPGPMAGFFFTEDPRVLAKHRKSDVDTQSFTYLSYIERGKRLRFSARLLLMAQLFHGGEYSNGAPLRSVTKLVTVAVHRDN